MCGITGGWSGHGTRELLDALPKMAAQLSHRGPDDHGCWSDVEAGICLAHRRLSILDLSPAGHQPMVSASGRWVIVFNGEIYNHAGFREELERAGSAPAWRGHSDTETLLAGIEAFGVAGALKRSVGMFALVVWDRQERALWLARDRMGEKPLYYGWSRGAFIFGSELKALRVYPGFNAAVEPQALSLYLRHSAVPAPFSIYKGISKLLPGHWIRLGWEDLNAGISPAPTAYWSAADCAQRGRAEQFSGSEDDAVAVLERLLFEAVGKQMLADVPLGAFLSGGIDSSLVVSLMQAQSNRPVRTYSIGFKEDLYNEAMHAAAVARHLGSDHTELYVTSADALSIIPRLPTIYDEPFADSSQIPMVLVSELARKNVLVALSGDGGDELFGGYSRHFLAAHWWPRISRIPRPLRSALATVMLAPDAASWDRAYERLKNFLPPKFHVTLPGQKIHKAAPVLAAPTGQALYEGLISHWDPASIMQTPVESSAFGPARGPWFLGLAERMMLEDACHYLPDDILVKVDRAAMSCGLETRVPMLDHRVFEFAWTLPMNYKIRGGLGKYLLRKLLARHVSPALTDRPKMGFGVPIDNWLRGPLKDWAAALLAPSRLRDEGYFHPGPITKRWNEHQSGARNWQHHLWDILMFQAWLENQACSEPENGG